MTFAADGQPQPPRQIRVPRKRSPLAITAIVLGVLVVIAVIAANIWTEIAWYRQVGFVDVVWTQWLARGVLFAVFGGIAALAVWGSLQIAKRARPARSDGRSSLDRYREQIQPLEKAVTIMLPILVGLVAGGAMASQWQDFLLYLNRADFGTSDPQFGLDASFYVFELPVYRSIVAYVLSIAILCAIVAAFIHLLYGSISGGGRKFIASRGARVQLAVLGLIVMIGVAANYWLDRFSLLTAQGELIYGASYTDVNAVLPSRGILAGIAIIVGLMFLVVIWRPDWRIPIIGVGLMVIAAVTIGGIYPSIVQRFQVNPNEQELETEYIQRNIDSTLVAYGLDDVEFTPYDATTQAEADALRADAETTAQIRLLDPNIVGPAFQQLQQNKQYYTFNDQLVVDRYDVGGESQDTVIAVRELNLDGLDQSSRNWVNDTTVYTHGFGVVAAYGNVVTSDGQPSFYEGGIPSSGLLDDYEPRIYFGQNLPPYSIVGAPEGTTPWELDYPDDGSTTGQQNTTYTGDGGPSIGNIFQSVMYAISFGEEQILFSDRVTSESQILYHRDPLERVARVAPYLEFDSTAYPAVVDGRVVWVVDGYTTTSEYPYSSQVNASAVFAGQVDELQPRLLNYVRNSVKATVDAYDGSVTLYAWDEEDPILQAWQSVFPTEYHSISEISSDLMSHLRYPEDLFQIQRYQLARYHVTDAASFFSQGDFWQVPEDPNDASSLQPSYYLTLQMPGQDDPTFSLTSNYIPAGTSPRNILTGYLAVNSETGNAEGEVDPDYGTLRLLELPRDTTIPGPGQVQNNFNADSDAQTVLNLLRSGESTVENGNLLTLPVGGGLLYVQPVYVQASTGTQVPLLRKVFVSFGDEVGFADTLGEALDQVFGEGASDGATDPDAGVDGDAVDDGLTDGGTDDGSSETPDATPDPEPTSTPDATEAPDVAEARAALNEALDRAQQAIDDGNAALADGDFAAYGEAQAALDEALQDAVTASDQLDAALAAAGA
ncbi:UPF0182 family membrane protein [Demequina zhanjiangensis]|uniref:UPF0182 protein QQX04_01455 n=1 Tax=Demequina zhanjiangensis TaxID=3051659 RepID=A0ABT8FXL6_9MICO|nr:UPF0182 family protein [Demequina sp. SYSU T00b26]MDN4471655.1 UPF0182 family protein [Demequina sp. SYSU T00b26]